MNLNNWKTKINCRRGELNLAATPACGGICIFQHSKEFSMVNIPTFELECTVSWRRNLSRGWQKERNVHTTDSVDANAKTQHRLAGKKRRHLHAVSHSECHSVSVTVQRTCYVQERTCMCTIWGPADLFGKQCFQSTVWNPYCGLNARRLTIWTRTICPWVQVGERGRSSKRLEPTGHSINSSL